MVGSLIFVQRAPMYSSLCRNCNLLYDTKKVLKTCFKTSRQSGPKMCRKRVVRRLYVALVLKSYNFFRVVKEVACDKIAPCKSTFRYMRTMHKVHFSTYFFSFSILFLLKSLLSSLSVSFFFPAEPRSQTSANESRKNRTKKKRV